MLFGTVHELWRYPVKSMLGERCELVTLDQRGIIGDRLYAVRDEAGKFGSGKTTRRFRSMDGLLGFRAKYDGNIPLVTFPDGVTLRGDDTLVSVALSAHLGIPVTLSREAEIPYFDAGALHLVTRASLRTLGASLAGGTPDSRRFRPNLLIETAAQGFAEDALCGRTVAIGDEVRVRVISPTERCVMVTLAQEDLPRDPHILRAVTQANDTCLGVYAEVLTPGDIRAGDAIRAL